MILQGLTLVFGADGETRQFRLDHFVRNKMGQLCCCEVVSYKDVANQTRRGSTARPASPSRDDMHGCISVAGGMDAGSDPVRVRTKKASAT